MGNLLIDTIGWHRGGRNEEGETDWVGFDSVADTTEGTGELRKQQHGWHRVPKGWSVCESVFLREEKKLGLAARCSKAC